MAKVIQPVLQEVKVLETVDRVLVPGLVPQVGVVEVPKSMMSIVAHSSLPVQVEELLPLEMDQEEMLVRWEDKPLEVNQELKLVQEQEEVDLLLEGPDPQPMQLW
jgi:hypothetical protein